jgi:hypothetical protein
MYKPDTFLKNSLQSENQNFQLGFSMDLNSNWKYVSMGGRREQALVGY